MNTRLQRGLILLSTLLVVGYSAAQSSCSALVETAIESVASSCYGLSRNQVCYGNISLNVTPELDAPNFTFERVGDIMDLSYLRTLRVAPLDELQGEWGIAMMQLQADIPESLPGQNVTFLVFGDVELENRASPEQSPMQSFYLRSAVGDATCADAPESGVLVQTPEGVKSVHFNINGVDVEIGSTVMLQANAEQQFIVRTLEGAAVVTIAGQSYPVIAGTEMSIPLDTQSQPMGLPSMPTSLSETAIEDLPIAPLPRQIPPPTPLPDAVEMKLQMRLEEGLEPCDTPGLPVCEHALTPDTNRKWAKKNGYAPHNPRADMSLETELVPTVSDVPGMIVTAAIETSVQTSNPVVIETPTNTGGPGVPVIATSAPQEPPPVEAPGDKDKDKEKKDKDKEKDKDKNK